MLKSTIAAVLMIALLALAPATGAKTHSAMTDGIVTKIDESASKITLKHGPIQKFNMDEGMTMVFRVQDAAMLKSVKVGDKVKFDADKINGQFTVTKVKKAG